MTEYETDKVKEVEDRPYRCASCQDWGCRECCETDAEIRAKQGTFG